MMAFKNWEKGFMILGPINGNSPGFETNISILLNRPQWEACT